MSPATDSSLFVALRAGFPADLDATAIETATEPPLFYTWRDLERASAMLANLLDSLDLPPGARIAVQAEKSVESLLLYLAALRAGFVYLPLNMAYKSDEIAYFIGNAAPSVFVCSPQGFRLGLGAIAFEAGTHLRLQPRRRPQRQPARTREPFLRPARAGRARRRTSSPPSSTPAAPPAAARARC